MLNNKVKMNMKEKKLESSVVNLATGVLKRLYDGNITVVDAYLELKYAGIRYYEIESIEQYGERIVLTNTPIGHALDENILTNEKYTVMFVRIGDVIGSVTKPIGLTIQSDNDVIYIINLMLRGQLSVSDVAYSLMCAGYKGVVRHDTIYISKSVWHFRAAIDLTSPIIGLINTLSIDYRVVNELG